MWPARRAAPRRRRPGAAPGRHGEGPARVDEVVHEQDRTVGVAQRRGQRGADGEPVPHAGQPERAVATRLAGRAALHEVERAEERQPPDRGDPLRPPRRPARAALATASPRPPPAARPSPSRASTSTQARRRSSDARSVRREDATQPLPQPRSVSRATARPGDIAASAAIRPETGTPSRDIAVGHCAPRLDLGAHPGQLLAGGVDGGRRERRREPRAGTAVAPPARRCGVVVERPLEELHPAAVAALVVQHQPLLAVARGGDPRIPLAVVLPRHPGGHPAAGDLGDRAVDVEDLEQQLEAGAADVDRGLQRGRGQRPTGLRERGEHGVGLLLAGHRRRGEVAPDVTVLGPGQQQHVGPLGGPPGAAHLLVVGDR